MTGIYQNREGGWLCIGIVLFSNAWNRTERSQFERSVLQLDMFEGLPVAALEAFGLQ